MFLGLELHDMLQLHVLLPTIYWNHPLITLSDKDKLFSYSHEGLNNSNLYIA